MLASPYARSIARELGVDLSLIESGSGPRGRITASDVEKASKEQTKKKAVAGKEKGAAPAAGTTPASFEIATSDRSYEDIPMSVMREVIAKRLSESKFTSPHYYVTFEFELDNLLRVKFFWMSIKKTKGICLIKYIKYVYIFVSGFIFVTFVIFVIFCFRCELT